MKCPHCLVTIHDSWEFVDIDNDAENINWKIFHQICPDCGEIIVALDKTIYDRDPSMFPNDIHHVLKNHIIYPKYEKRPPLSEEVPESYSEDYKEAVLVLSVSPKASAAISRRCLQLLLREEAKVKHQDLSKEIEEVLTRNIYPSYLSRAIDGIRNYGNFATHPIKCDKTGEIIEVESGEAEWILDVLESLFDFHFVQPSKLDTKRAELNAKLASAKKPPMK